MGKIIFGRILPAARQNCILGGAGRWQTARDSHVRAPQPSVGRIFDFFLLNKIVLDEFQNELSIHLSCGLRGSVAASHFFHNLVYCE